MGFLVPKFSPTPYPMRSEQLPHQSPSIFQPLLLLKARTPLHPITPCTLDLDRLHVNTSLVDALVQCIFGDFEAARLVV